MAFIPSADRIVGIELIERKTAGGIVIPDTAAGNDPSKAKILRIQVLAIGPGNLHVEAGNTRRIRISEMLGVDIKVGDVVLANRFCNQMKVDGQDVRVFGPSDVLGVETV